MHDRMLDPTYALRLHALTDHPNGVSSKPSNLANSKIRRVYQDILFVAPLFSTNDTPLDTPPQLKRFIGLCASMTRNGDP